VGYGGRTSFDVRKIYTNVSKCDGKVTSCRYVCANEDHRRKGQTDHVTKCFRILKLSKANMNDLWLHALEYWMNITNMLFQLEVYIKETENLVR